MAFQARGGRRGRNSARDDRPRADPFAEPADRGDGRGKREQRDAEPVDPVVQAREICLRLLTDQPRTRQELSQRLARREIEPDIAERVLDRLDEVGLIDDAAFAEQWVQSRHQNRGLARRALAAELRRKGVDSTIAAEAVEAVDAESEEERARELVRKKLRATASADEPTKIRRLVGMLARKGYPEGVAYRVVREELRTAGEDSDLLDTLRPD